ncbi:phosphoglucomutase/phosphomannomutase family protein [Gloeocapsopsis dulcis]|uniref:Phosphoglucosamine mutase n=1 Tax=Gloeocapsopsis dulcis AAB1 = 1H9 TaxID=1433147 RepID=A0A6N8FTH8_9CHRO|nr:phosphoglucomutase/phosphomannomutase family protein [Gloeocapsopsis dulcis]MUL36403.1 phosphoglucosamine mutase [Gloeocapsopsis dulcis AAB1 = 1H9]WNN88103.1 phosphoglucomutase/phosphomannomutase family protein [Gloeocapsopsis dulcis]
MSDSKIKFGTDGWRGSIADDFTFANVRKVTRAIAAYLQTRQHQPLLIGYDTRFLADQFAQTAAEVLTELGWQVQIASEYCPTPAIAYNVRHRHAVGALMFTASHNPANYCGIKFIPDYAGPATADITDAIIAQLSDADSAPPDHPVDSAISQFDPKPDYLKFIYAQLDVERMRAAKLKIKYDALYSTTQGYLDTALRHCGCEVEAFHTNRDVLFGGGMPQPDQKHMSELAAKVKHQADVGMATDGDGDRFGIIDEQGNFLSPHVILLVLARHLLLNKHKTGAIIRSVATTHLLDNFAAQHGLKIYETPVGFKHIGEKMRQIDVLIGGEESGGLSIAGHIPEKDGMMANLLVTEAIAYAGTPLSELVAIATQEVGGPLYNQRQDLELPEVDKTAVLDALKQNPPQEIAGIKVKETSYESGIKLYLEDSSWVLLRPSGTEPVMRVYIETVPAKKQQITAAVDNLIAASK